MKIKALNSNARLVPLSPESKSDATTHSTGQVTELGEVPLELLQMSQAPVVEL